MLIISCVHIYLQIFNLIFCFYYVIIYIEQRRRKEFIKMKIYVIDCNGFQGSAYYSRFDEAQAAADWRTHCTGMEWKVRELMLP